MRILEHRFGYGLSIGILLLCAFGAVYSLQFKAVSMWFPFFAGTAGAVISVLVIVFDVIGDRRHGIDRDGPREDVDELDELADAVEAASGVPGAAVDVETGALPAVGRSDSEPRDILLGFAKYLAWFVAFVALFLLFGVLIAVPVWLFTFIRLAARESWLRAVIGAVAMTALIFLLAAFLALAMPHGVLIDSSALIPRWRF